MPRYAAFLRGVYPINLKMPDLRRAFEAAGFSDVRTVLASGNVVFSARRAADATLERKAEAAMQRLLGRTFLTIVRPVAALREMLAADPHGAFRLSPRAKRIVTLLRATPRSRPRLPIELHGARILSITDKAVFSAYLPTPKGPVFMALIEKTFGKDVTTRTWDTVAKIVRAAAA